MTKVCPIDGCKRNYHAKGYCLFHYRRNRFFGDPLYNPPRKERKKKEYSHTREPEYTNWVHMRKRCSRNGARDPNSYYSKGITICDRWMEPKIGFMNYGDTKAVTVSGFTEKSSTGA